jgi:hypothetical protein
VFSRVGIYCYWDFVSRDILYVGLSGGLYKRFRQHNGLIACQANCCKREKIEEYFAGHDRLGISLLLQSKMQDDGVLSHFDDWMIEDMFGISDTAKNVAFAEGNLIDAHETRYGSTPPWNGNKASKEGHGAPTVMRGSRFFDEMMEFSGEEPKAPQFDMLADLVGKSFSPLVGRNTIREVPTGFRTLATEDTMHGVRMMMVDWRVSYEQAAALHKGQPQGEVLKLIEMEKYLDRRPSIFT